MSFSPAPKATHRISVQESVTLLLRDLVQERTGVYFETGRTDTMLEKLEPRAVACGCQSYLDYFYLLKYDAGAQEEWRRVMDAFSVQETYFWREADQISRLVTDLVPAWFRRATQPMRIWSAACATGEEPYSIAIALAEAGWSNHPIEIIGSDASEAALAKARAGLFRERSFRTLPAALRQKYFVAEGGGSRLRSEISRKVTFEWANLMRLDEFPKAAAVEVIFCRNVFIYFSTSSIEHVVSSFAKRLAASGVLFVGSSESLLKLTTQFDLAEMGGAFGYVRKADEP